MKKVVCFLLIIISMFSFSLLFNNEKLKQNGNIERVEQSLSNSHDIMLPSKIDKENIEKVYNCIKEVVKVHNANIYFSKVGSDGQFVKFVYLTNLSYFDNFEISNGRGFNLNDMESDKYLSSNDTGDEKQLGVISIFAGTEVFEVKTLRSMLDADFLLSGQCTVQLSDNDDINLFMKDLEEKLNIVGVQEEDLKIEIPDYYYNKWIVPSLYCMITLLILYSILKSYKKYGIQKMLGYSNKDIWLKEVLVLTVVQGLIFIIVSIIMSLILFKQFNVYYIRFLKKLFLYNLCQFAILFIVASIPFIYLQKISVVEVIKNKRNIKDIIIFNSVLKSLLIVLSFSLISKGINNFDKIQNVFNDKYKAWDAAEGYYIIPLMNVKNGDITSEEEKSIADLYFNINKDGAVMANFTSFSPEQRQFAIEDKKPSYESDIVTVNPNYLKENLVYDLNDNPIYISENEKDLILLVPDKYKENEKEIRDMWEIYKKGYGENSVAANEKTKIIYIKSNQNTFSYEADVNLDNGNMVNDAILRVVTESNGTEWEFGTVIGYTGNPIKIKVDPYLSAEDYIYEKLREVGLEKYVDKIVPANDGIAFESKSVYKLLMFIIGGLVIILIAMIIIIMQNIVCFFEQYSKKIAIRGFNGMGILEKYKECFNLIFITSLIAFIISIYINMDLKILIPLSIAFMFIDLLMTIVMIRYINKKRISSIIKGC